MALKSKRLNRLPENLETIIDSNVNHLSLYQLTIEPNTIFYKKELLLPDEEGN
jgi:oxygen-independent coproporphyrinogen-3 oxidase